MRTILALMISIALAATALEARAQSPTSELAYSGIELCVILLREPERAVDYGAERGIVMLRSDAGDTQFGTAASAIPWLVASSARTREAHAFTCEFSLESAGELAGQEIRALASRLGLVYQSNGDEHSLLSESNSQTIVASIRSTDLAPCPTDGGAGDSDEVLAAYLRVCGRTTVEFSMVSVGPR